MNKLSTPSFRSDRAGFFAISFILIVLFAFPISYAKAQEGVFFDDFDDDPVDNTSVDNIVGWDETGTDSDSATNAQASGSGDDSASPDGGRFARINQGEWICAVVDASGFENLELSYYWRGDSDTSDDEASGIIEYHSGSGSCDVASGWVELEKHDLVDSSDWNGKASNPDFTVSLTPVNDSIFRIRFRVDSVSDEEDVHFRLDAVSIEGDACGEEGCASSSGGGGEGNSTEDTEALCTDELDNDGDELVDENDPDCDPFYEEEELLLGMAGYKFFDERYFGRIDDGEDYLSGWVINLYEKDGDSWSLLKSESTDENGEYNFSDYPEKDYLICEELKSGWRQTSPCDSEADGCYFKDDREHVSVVANSSPNASSEAELCYQIDLDETKVSGDTANNLNFGNDAIQCLVEGFKYDLEGHGLEGWTIGFEGSGVLEGEEDPVDLYFTDLTDENGYYCIEEDVSLEEGEDYSVFEELQDGFEADHAVLRGGNLEEEEMIDFFEEGTWLVEGEVNQAHVSIDLDQSGYFGEVDFYNQATSTDSGEGDGNGGGDNENGGGGGSSSGGGESISTSGARSSGGSSSSSSGTSGQVLGASIGPNGGQCNPWLSEFIGVGEGVDPVEILKLQIFLNTVEGESLEINGLYDEATADAVSRFQLSHREKVLAPWGLALPTGISWITTTNEINTILGCGAQLPPPPLKKLNSAGPAPLSPAQIFSDGFESGDTSSWQAR